MSKIIAIIQARMGSTRLPGKMLMPIIDGKGPLQLMLERIAKSVKIDEVIIGTSTSDIDNRIEELCTNLQVKCFRGNEDDVLDRFYSAVKAYGPADTIVRLTGDCPLHDHTVIDKVIDAFVNKLGTSFASNVNPPSYPDGLDVEIFSYETLEKTWREAKKPYQRQHVTSYMTENPKIFNLLNVSSDVDYSSMRWTLDQPADFDFIKAVYENFYHQKNDFNMHDIIDFLENNPELKNLNSAFERDAEYYKEVEEQKSQ